MSIKVRLEKLINWEHWPTFMFYVPLIPFLIFKTIRAKHLVFFLATNPGIKYSGSGSESKYQTIIKIPEKYRPKSILVNPGSDLETVKQSIKAYQINWPIIVKPDIGFRGYLVRKLDYWEDLQLYHQNMPLNYIIQEFVDYPLEMGLFYYKIPGEKRGHITSITLKAYATITGDGIHTIDYLIKNDSRIFVYYELLSSLLKDDLNTILKKGESRILSHIGNHSKGTRFVNGNHLISKSLSNMVDQLQSDIDGWFYGRIDLKYRHFDDLLKGNHFKVLEINGIISEPTHIYDTAQGATYTKAIKEIKSHWKIIDQIARINHEQNNISYPKVWPYLKEMMALRKHAKMLKKLN